MNLFKYLKPRQLHNTIKEMLCKTPDNTFIDCDNNTITAKQYQDFFELSQIVHNYALAGFTINNIETEVETFVVVKYRGNIYHNL